MTLCFAIVWIAGRRKGKVLDSCDEGLSKKDLALQQAIDQITTSFGKGSIMWLGRSAGTKSVPVISTGSFALDIALGIGGVPKVLNFLQPHVWFTELVLLFENFLSLEMKLIFVPGTFYCH